MLNPSPLSPLFSTISSTKDDHMAPQLSASRDFVALGLGDGSSCADAEGLLLILLFGEALLLKLLLLLLPPPMLLLVLLPPSTMDSDWLFVARETSDLALTRSSSGSFEARRRLCRLPLRIFCSRRERERAITGGEDYN